MRLVTAAAFGAACVSAASGLAYGAPANPAQERAEAAYQAMGGDKLEQLTSIVLKATMQQWDPGESYSVADLTKPDVGSSTYTLTLDNTKGFQRYDWVRPRAGGGMHLFRNSHAEWRLCARQRFEFSPRKTHGRQSAGAHHVGHPTEGFAARD